MSGLLQTSSVSEIGVERSSDDIFDGFDEFIEAVGAQQLAERVFAIAPDMPEEIPTRIIVERQSKEMIPAGIPLCLESRNLVNPDVREKFVTEIIFPDNDIFTEPSNTTDTMEGYLSGVNFDERTPLDFETDEHVVSIRSNYMTLIHPGYTEPQKPKTTNRGRKKQEKKRKVHKKQGTGEEFNSQISFHVRYKVPGDEGYDPMRKPYKFKVFRTGRLQLPGAKQSTLPDVFWCLGLVQEKLQRALKVDVPKLETFSVVMKNYKFITKMPLGYILNLAALKKILESERTANHSREIPPIFMIKFDSEDSKLSVLFRTPTDKKPDKMVRVKVFMRGRINILGAIDDRTSQICEYLFGLFGSNQTSLFVIEGGYNLATINTIGYADIDTILARHDTLWYEQTYQKVLGVFRQHLELRQ